MGDLVIMRFLSVCSGIEAASVAWGSLGFKAVNEILEGNK